MVAIRYLAPFLLLLLGCSDEPEIVSPKVELRSEQTGSDLIEGRKISIHMADVIASSESIKFIKNDFFESPNLYDILFKIENYNLLAADAKMSVDEVLKKLLRTLGIDESHYVDHALCKEIIEKIISVNGEELDQKALDSFGN